MAQLQPAVRERELSLEERRRILDEEVVRRQRHGWVVVYRTETTVQMQKSVQAIPTWAIILLTVITLGIIWLFLFAFKKTATLFIEVDEQGRLHSHVRT